MLLEALAIAVLFAFVPLLTTVARRGRARSPWLGEGRLRDRLRFVQRVTLGAFLVPCVAWAAGAVTHDAVVLGAIPMVLAYGGEAWAAWLVRPNAPAGAPGRGKGTGRGTGARSAR
jgi:hypothetical protein